MKISEQTQENYPYMTVINYVDKEVVGIIINQDSQITSMYDYEVIRSDSERKEFLELGETWWWESNRKIPINIFMKLEMSQFRHLIKSFTTKDVDVLFGPVVRLNDIAQKRVKRKSIQLVRKLK